MRLKFEWFKEFPIIVYYFGCGFISKFLGWMFNGLLCHTFKFVLRQYHIKSPKLEQNILRNIALRIGLALKRNMISAS